MPRAPRVCPAGMVFHVLNRANARRTIFFDDADYAAFERVLAEAVSRVPAVSLLSYCLMPNHWHMVLSPGDDGAVSEFMRWLSVTHTQRWHAHHHTSGTGHLYQGRFKSFPVEADGHFLAVCRYVERNALRAGLVTRAEAWRWSSLWRRVHGNEAGLLASWPVSESIDWMSLVNRPQSVAEENALRQSILKSRPFGSEDFEAWTVELLGLTSTLRDPGRPLSMPD